jgi:carbamoyltransferase
VLVLGLVDLAINSAACLAEDGAVLAAVAEERTTRVKRCGGFPSTAVAACLREAGRRPGDVERVAVGYRGYEAAIRAWSSLPSARLPPATLSSWRERLPVQALEGYRALRERSGSLSYIDGWASRRILAAHLRRSGVRAPVEHLGHHLCHAAASHLTSGDRRSLVVVADAYGEGRSGGVFLGDGPEVEALSSFSADASLGYLYGAATELIGLRFGFDEGKTMALAAYGTPRHADTLREGLTVESLAITGTATAARRLLSLRWAAALGGRARDDIAASAQAVLEGLVSELVQRAVDETGVRDVALGGGVFLNVRLNGRVLALDAVRSVSVHPEPGDGGAAVGAALLASARRGTFRPQALPTPYLGTSLAGGAVEALGRDRRLSVERGPDALARAGGELLPSGRLVGTFMGRMEWGPRALGNRSVLADARDPSAPEQVRRRIKRRPAYQPFCQSLLAGAARRHLANPKGARAPYMVLAFDSTPEAREETPAVVHVDGSCRPQVVEPGANPPFEELIRAFGRATGVEAVLNTSFNASGEPIVERPEQALAHLLAGRVDALVVGDALVTRR